MMFSDSPSLQADIIDVLTDQADLVARHAAGLGLDHLILDRGNGWCSVAWPSPGSDDALSWVRRGQTSSTAEILAALDPVASALDGMKSGGFEHLEIHPSMLGVREGPPLGFSLAVPLPVLASADEAADSGRHDARSHGRGPRRPLRFLHLSTPERQVPATCRLRQRPRLSGDPQAHGAIQPFPLIRHRRHHRRRHLPGCHSRTRPRRTTPRCQPQRLTLRQLDKPALHLLCSHADACCGSTPGAGTRTTSSTSCPSPPSTTKGLSRKNPSSPRSSSSAC